MLAASVFVLAFIGWNAYGPVSDYLNGRLTAAPHGPVKPPKDADTAASSSESPVMAVVDSGPPPVEKPDSNPSKWRAIYLSEATVSSPAALDAALAALSGTEINAVMFDLKNAAGSVRYQSALDVVRVVGSQDENAFDLAALCKKLEGANLVPIGRMSAFRDPFAAPRIPGSFVKYMDSELTWLDNSLEEGGRPWFNPYSPEAQSYVSDIAAEAAALGVKRIVLEDFSFPVGYGLKYASYGPAAATMTHPEVLTRFLSELDSRLSSAGSTLYPYLAATAALGANDVNYDANPLTIVPGRLLLGVMPSQFGGEYKRGGLELAAPEADAGGTVTKLLGSLSPRLAGKETVAMVQAYPASTGAYSSAEIKAQLDACAANKIDSYLIYSPDGRYPK